MLTPKEFLGIKKKFENDETVMLIVKNYPVFCKVLDAQEHLMAGMVYKLAILNEELKEELGDDARYIWIPAEHINSVRQA